MTTYFNERIISLVVALHNKGRFTWTICTNTHFYHLAAKESSGIVFTDVGCDTANVQRRSRLPRQRRVGAYTHSNCLDRDSAVNTSDRRYPSTFNDKKIQELYEGCGQTSSTEVGNFWPSVYFVCMPDHCSCSGAQASDPGLLRLRCERARTSVPLGSRRHRFWRTGDGYTCLIIARVYKLTYGPQPQASGEQCNERNRSK